MGLALGLDHDWIPCATGSRSVPGPGPVFWASLMSRQARERSRLGDAGGLLEGRFPQTPPVPISVPLTPIYAHS